MPDLSLDQLKQIASIKNYKPIKTKSTLYGNYIKYESKRDKDKNLSPKEYFDMIKPYLSDIINNHKTQFGECKIQLTMPINFISPGETSTMHTRSDNIKIMMGSETNDIIEKLRESHLQRYQERLEDSMRGSEFLCDSVGLMYYHLSTQ